MVLWEPIEKFSLEPVQANGPPLAIPDDSHSIGPIGISWITMAPHRKNPKPGQIDLTISSGRITVPLHMNFGYRSANTYAKKRNRHRNLKKKNRVLTQPMMGETYSGLDF